VVRELRRLSRRGTTWLARFVAGALGLGAVLVILVDYGEVDVGRMSAIGANLYGAYVVGQLMLVGLLAPLQAAMAVEEERLDRALDLLVLTPMARGTLLWGKVASRLVHLMGVVIGGLPILGLIGTFGGVSAWKVVSLTANTALMAVLLAEVATILVIAQRGSPLLAAMGAWMWGGFVTMACMSGFVWNDYAWLPPPAAAFQDTAWGLLPTVVFFPVVLGLGWLGPLLFRLATGESEDDELGLLSPEVWTLHRHRRRTLWVLPLLVVLTLAYTWGMERVGFRQGAAVFLPIPLILTWSAAFVGMTVLELGSGRVVTMAARARRAVVQRRTYREESRAVSRWPLLWRLFRTRVAAAVQPLLMGSLGLWGMGLMFSLLIDGGRDRWVVPGLAGWAMAVGLAGLLPLATTAVDSDPRRRQLLVLAGVRPRNIVASHVAHAVARSLPLLVVGTAAILYNFMLYPPGGDWGSPWGICAVFTVLTLSSSTLIATQSTLIGFVAPRRTVWLVGIGAGLMLTGMPTVLSETFNLWRDDGVLATALSYWSPLVVDDGGSPEWHLLRASLAHVVASLIGLTATTWWVGRHHR